MPDPNFHLVFRGELLEGEDKTVVAKRLMALLKLDAARIKALFSGKPVVLKRNAPRELAAKYQAAFKKAGARLRVVPVKVVDEAPHAAPGQVTSATPAATDKGRPAEALVTDDAPGVNAFSLAPASGDLVAEDERLQVAEVEIDISHLSAAPPETGSFEDVIERQPPPPAPDVSGISLAEAGADLGPAEKTIAVAVAIPDLDLSAAGALIETLPTPPPPPVPTASFDLAEAGADMDTRAKPAPPPPPDVSHLGLASDERIGSAAPG